MAHQAHNIPWSILVNNFAYTKDTHGVSDIRAQDKPGQPKALVHFAKAFAKAVRTYAEVERRKYPPADEFKKRAKTWTHSDRRPDDEAENDDVREPEGRPHGGHVNLGGSNAETQYIDDWILGDRHWTREDGTTDWRLRDKWVTYWTNDWKTLLMEAALVTVPLHERQAKRDELDPAHLKHLDTLFLLAHHPSIPLRDWYHEGDGCCNIESGLVCVAEAVVTGYICINMLFAMRESAGSSKVFSQTSYFNTEHWRSRILNVEERLAPRPNYMITPSWWRYLQKVCRDHEHHLESMMFEPFLNAREGENFTVLPSASHTEDTPGWVYGRRGRYQLKEVDIMAPPQGQGATSEEENLETDPSATRGHHEALRELLRGLWRLMVNFEMLWRDQGNPPEWEVMVVDALESCIYADHWWSLFWDSHDQALERRSRDLFVDGKVERLPRQEALMPAQASEQRKRNAFLKREARREARSEDKCQKA